MYGIIDLYIMLLVSFVVKFSGIGQTYNMEIISVVRKFSGNRINFWHVKILWSWE